MLLQYLFFVSNTVIVQCFIMFFLLGRTKKTTRAEAKTTGIWVMKCMYEYY